MALTVQLVVPPKLGHLQFQWRWWVKRQPPTIIHDVEEKVEISPQIFQQHFLGGEPIFCQVYIFRKNEEGRPLWSRYGAADITPQIFQKFSKVENFHDQPKSVKIPLKMHEAHDMILDLFFHVEFLENMVGQINNSKCGDMWKWTAQQNFEKSENSEISQLAQHYISELTTDAKFYIAENFEKSVRYKFYKTRTQDLPASTYFLNRCSEPTNRHLILRHLKIVLDRCEISPQNFLLGVSDPYNYPTKFRDACQVMGRVLRLFATSLPYGADELPDGKGIEQFSVARYGMGDDCEGLALEVKMRHDELLSLKDETEPLLGGLYKLATMYVPTIALCVALRAAAQQSSNKSGQSASKTAHAVHALVPYSFWTETKPDYEPAWPDVPVYTQYIEGTGLVRPLPLQPSQYSMFESNIGTAANQSTTIVVDEPADVGRSKPFLTKLFADLRHEEHPFPSNQTSAERVMGFYSTVLYLMHENGIEAVVDPSQINEAGLPKLGATPKDFLLGNTAKMQLLPVSTLTPEHKQFFTDFLRDHEEWIPPIYEPTIEEKQQPIPIELQQLTRASTTATGKSATFFMAEPQVQESVELLKQFLIDNPTISLNIKRQAIAQGVVDYMLRFHVPSEVDAEVEDRPVGACV